MAELKIQPNEIRDALANFVKSYDPGTAARDEVGTVSQAGDGIARVEGLPSTMANELLQFENGTLGLALNLDVREIGVVILGDYAGIEEGTSVRGTGEVLSVPVGDGFLGRVVDPLGRPIDGKGEIKPDARRALELQRLESLRRKIANGKSDSSDLQAEYQATQEKLISCPEQFVPRLLVGDVTPEALARTMSEQKGTIAVIQPEGGLIANLNGRYSDGMANLDLVNQAYGAEPVHVTRQGRPDIYMERPHMAIALNVQPAVFREMSASAAMTQKGFLDRFLMTKPISLLGHRLPESAKPLNRTAYLDWCNYVGELAGYATELMEQDKLVTIT